MERRKRLFVIRKCEGNFSGIILSGVGAVATF
jgi:hypothetical protein